MHFLSPGRITISEPLGKWTKEMNMQFIRIQMANKHKMFNLSSHIKIFKLKQCKFIFLLSVWDRNKF